MWDRRAQPSIRINNQWRVCFTWQSGDAHGVEIVDYLVAKDGRLRFAYEALPKATTPSR
jgi:hypothetical protein